MIEPTTQQMRSVYCGEIRRKTSRVTEDHKKTQRALAQRLHVTSGTISNYENGNHLPDVDKLVDLADLFGVSTDYLLDRCNSQLPLSHWDAPLLDNMTAGEVIHLISRLSPSRKSALLLILHDLSSAQQRFQKEMNPNLP